MIDLLASSQQVVTQQKDLIDVLQILILPVVLVALPIILNRTKHAARASKEAADSVRPNGSGHSSVVHMVEEVLMTLGEFKADIRDLKDGQSGIQKEFAEHLVAANKHNKQIEKRLDGIESSLASSPPAEF